MMMGGEQKLKILIKLIPKDGIYFPDLIALTILMYGIRLWQWTLVKKGARKDGIHFAKLQVSVKQSWKLTNIL